MGQGRAKIASKAAKLEPRWAQDGLRWARDGLLGPSCQPLGGMLDASEGENGEVPKMQPLLHKI